VERVLVENDLLNPFNDHVRRLKVDSSLPDFGGRASAGASTKEQHPRRLLHHSELCDGKFVSNLHAHPIFPGSFTIFSHFMLTSFLVFVFFF